MNKHLSVLALLNLVIFPVKAEDKNFNSGEHNYSGSSESAGQSEVSRDEDNSSKSSESTRQHDTATSDQQKFSGSTEHASQDDSSSNDSNSLGSLGSSLIPRGAPSAKESIFTYFRHLKESLSQSAVVAQRKKNRVGSVAAVRGADQSSVIGNPNEPVLKGDARAKKEKANMAEDAEFAKAVDLVLAGKTKEGTKALIDFKAKYPKSRNAQKASDALEQVKALERLKESK